MIFGFVTYVKNRRIGSPYPIINARPATKALKTEKKIRIFSLAKLVKFVNTLPLLRYKDATIIMGNTIELMGTFIDSLIIPYALIIIIYARQKAKISVCVATAAYLCRNLLFRFRNDSSRTSCGKQNLNPL